MLVVVCLMCVCVLNYMVYISGMYEYVGIDFHVLFTRISIVLVFEDVACVRRLNDMKQKIYG